MLAKLTSKNQLTLPKAAIEAVGPGEYFEVEVRVGQIVLTPVRLQRADAVRAKLDELGITEADVGAALAWARVSAPTGALLAAEPSPARAARAAAGAPRQPRKPRA